MKQTPKILNILGLAVAIAAFMVVAMVRYYDLRYDKSYPGADRIYEVKSWRNDYTGDKFKFTTIQNKAGIRRLADVTPENVAKLPSDLPFEELEDVCLARGYGYGLYHLYAPSLPEVDTLVPMQVATPSVFRFFGIKLKAGSLETFGDDNNIVITNGLAKHLFPKGDAVGQKLVIATDPDDELGDYAELNSIENGDTVTVIAVCKDLPQNTSMAYYGIIRCFNPKQIKGHIYYKLKEGCEKYPFEKRMFEIYQSDYQAYMATQDTTGDSQLCYTERAEKYENAPKECDSMSLELLSEQHFSTNNFWNVDEEHSTNVSKVLSVFGIVLLLLAFLNFTNYAVATVPMFLRKTNIRKIEGCSNAQLRWEMFGRFLLSAVIAFLIALVIVEVCARTKVIPFVEISLKLADNLPVVWISAAVTLLVAVVASLYPVFYTTAAANVESALKSQLATPQKYGKWRKVLLRMQTTPASVVQFFASFAIILFMTLVFVQNHSMKTADVGFKTDNVYVSVGRCFRTDFSNSEGVVNIDPYMLQNMFDSVSGVHAVAFAMDPVMGHGEVVSIQGILIGDEQIHLNARTVSLDFFDFFGIEVVRGRMMARPIGSIHTESMVNEAALQENEALYSDSLRKSPRVVGVVRDYHNLSLTNEILPCIYSPYAHGLARGLRTVYFYVKLGEGQDIQRVEEEILKKLKSAGVDDFKLGHFQSLKQEIDKEYEKEDDFAKLTALFGAATLFVTLTGLIGMVMLDCSYRRRELALRRVYGASTGNQLWKMIRNQLIISIITFAAATPLAVSLFHKWQQHFAYKADIPVWPFLATFLTVTLLALGITAWQTLRTLRDEPDI
ncbi:MAG: ABC transporter permease [Bacteroidales bacterium]|nr:ABC transporter permease [Bacteroidales bacterium]